MQAFGQESWKDDREVSWLFVMLGLPGISSTFPCLGGPPLCGPCGPVLTASGLPTESLLSHPLSVEACGTGSQPGQPRDPSPK